MTKIRTYGKSNPIPKLYPKQKRKIREYHKSMTVQQLVALTSSSKALVEAFLKENNLTALVGNEEAEFFTHDPYYKF